MRWDGIDGKSGKRMRDGDGNLWEEWWYSEYSESTISTKQKALSARLKIPQSGKKARFETRVCEEFIVLTLFFD